MEKAKNGINNLKNILHNLKGICYVEGVAYVKYLISLFSIFSYSLADRGNVIDSFGVYCAVHYSFRRLLVCWKTYYAGRTRKKIWMSVPLCNAWTLQRNMKCCEDKKEMTSVITYRCVQNFFY